MCLRSLHVRARISLPRLGPASSAVEIYMYFLLTRAARGETGNEGRGPSTRVFSTPSRSGPLLALSGVDVESAERPVAYKQAALQLSATAANAPVKSSHSQSLHSS